MNINVLGDGLDEDEETFEVALSLPVPVQESAAVATFQIALSDPSGKTLIVEYMPANGTAQPVTDFVSTVGTVTFLPGELQKTVTIGIVNNTVAEATQTFQLFLTANVSTANGTAIAGTDYQSLGTTLTMAAGTTSTTVSVLVNRDAVTEANETFQVNLASIVNAVGGIVSSTATITNDD